MVLGSSNIVGNNKIHETGTLKTHVYMVYLDSTFLSIFWRYAITENFKIEIGIKVKEHLKVVFLDIFPHSLHNFSAR